MKLKTIDIKAFRLFCQQHLDFTNERHGGEGSCANFVSIYAPNGFGKTSLFDAIEFGMTGNIHRLKLGNFDEQMKYDGKISDFSSFIHNKKMPGEKVCIRLGVEGFGNGEVVQEVEPDAEKDMLTGNGYNAFFTNAILSQDWFSEFLSATTAEERFRSFMRNFHQSDDLLEYHSTLKSTLTSLSREKGNRQRALEQLKNKLKNDVDEHIVERLDEAFGKLKESGIQIGWERKIDGDSLTKLKMEVDLVTGSIDAEKRNHELLLENIQRLMSGQGELLAPEKIREQRSLISVLKSQIAEKEKALANVVRLKTLLEQMAKLRQERKECRDELERLTKLINGYAQFVLLLSEMGKQERLIRSCDGNAEVQKKEKERIETQQKNVEMQREEWQHQMTVLTNKLSQLPSDYEKCRQLLAEISNKEKTEMELQAGLAKKKEERGVQEKRKVRLLEIQKCVAARQIDCVVEEYKQQSLSLIEIGQHIKQKEGAIKQEEEAIKRQTAYQGQVEELLVRARGMVDEMRTGVCPLCGHDFGKIEELLKSIEGNKAVSSSIEAAMARITTLKEEIKAESDKAEALYQELAELLKQAVAKLGEEMTAHEKEFGEMTARLEETQRIIAENKKTIAENYKDFEGLQQEQIRQQYEDKRKHAEEKLNACDKILAELKGKVGENVKLIEQNEQERMNAQEAMQAIVNGDDYQSYCKLLKDGEKADEETLTLWKTVKQDKDKVLTGYDARVQETQAAISKLKEEEKVDQTQEASLTGDLTKLKSDLTATEGVLARTMQFIKRDCKMKDVSEEIPVNEIILHLDSLKKQGEAGVALAEKKKKRLGELDTLIVAAGKYNQQQLLKIDIRKAEDSLTDAVKGQENVKKEITRLQEYLSKYVENFFQVDLINELYNRIDPHPEYKEVKFECDFTLTRPRLNVYMGSRDEKNDQIVPNLYFSTAQVNILSFCIFLAKAMFAKTDDGQEVGCIFIDDPIQALDDINILSMIDLLRNVAFTMNKQIVITTHDQNFFGLLQKKIPQDRFNACYWEIYERGKFRKVV